MRIPDATLRLSPPQDGFRQRVRVLLVHRQSGRPTARKRVIDVRVDQLLQDCIIQHVAVHVRQCRRQSHRLRRGVVRGVHQGHGFFLPTSDNSNFSVKVPHCDTSLVLRGDTLPAPVEPPMIPLAGQAPGRPRYSFVFPRFRPQSSAGDTITRRAASDHYQSCSVSLA